VTHLDVSRDDVRDAAAAVVEILSARTSPASRATAVT